MYISGDCVGNGYYNKPSLTQERFLKDPFCKDYIIYKTGDLAKYDKDGNIYFLGRSDFQVKINGYRIEIEEVEKKILLLKEIKNVAILVEKDNLEKSNLVGYIEADELGDYSEFKEKISKILPQYMIPSKFYLIDKMPLNINGKVDKKKLEDNKEEYKIYSATNKRVLPQNNTESKILKCMQKVLRYTDISVLDDFFEMGGDSISAIELQIKLEEENLIFNTQEIYDNPTARKLAEYKKKEKVKAQDNTYKEIVLPAKTIEIKEKNNILLTGATGFLGIHILNELLKTENNIYCLIRKNNNKDPKERLLDKYKYYFDKNISNLINKKVFIINGDLIKDKFGMKLNDYNNLLKNIDIVINVAASVKHYGKRDYNFEHNVVSTKNILSFAKESNSILNHISTVGIAGNNLVDTNDCYKDTFSEKDLIIGQKYDDNVYVSTKLQAEQNVIEAIQGQIINGNILRVGNLTNRYSDNKFQENKDTNAFQNKIKEIIDLKYLPSEMKNFTFDLTPVDLCANAIVRLAFYNKYNNIYHVLNNKELDYNQIAKILLSFDIKLENEMKLTKENKEKIKWLSNDFILKNKRKIKIESEKTQNILGNLGFKWENSEEYYIRVFKSITGRNNDE